jgi:hypothetical protein
MNKDQVEGKRKQSHGDIVPPDALMKTLTDAAGGAA